jgi:hypothetical protein
VGKERTFYIWAWVKENGQMNHKNGATPGTPLRKLDVPLKIHFFYFNLSQMYNIFLEKGIDSLFIFIYHYN